MLPVILKSAWINPEDKAKQDGERNFEESFFNAKQT